ncbi:flagellar filament capping protein FliD [Morganella morganii]|uniref:flagellar filament capping protein FliD n=1 Tax=Morganella morganii TaxID=582 RepID=UPI001299A984|nr:flagellar filament capping protein FliD [Morganella morganii]MBT0381392.1 flagellar filament capping protein FliD [Morganella morganii subsp. morganii]MBT0419771.1 flagellar filament capping protein FliD [Morganella morganii subsp. morganii]MBT0514723.1 flagellar filament capping protein FliD [Morganella morganii subsp. morganii]MRE58254.1 flagellar filament capping protein FliD [Morganella morganii]QWM02847.1 flagellar filament capping protein FliD [Morganella morganii subsp. morganii]
MAGIASLGVGAGMDLNQQLDMLEKAEMRRLEPLTAQKTACDAQISAFGKLQASLEKLKSAAEGLKKYGDISTTKVSEENKYFGVSTTGKAQPGQYDVSIERLAKNQTLSGKGVADGKTSMGNSNAERTVSIKIGDGSDAKKNFDIKLSSDKTSPIEVADAINKADKGVSASVVKDKQGEYHLVLISKTQGTDSAISISVTGDDDLDKAIGGKSEKQTDGTVKFTGNGGMKQTTAPENALFTVNGIEQESQTNEVKDAFFGLTLTLKKTTEKDSAGKPITEPLVVSSDIEPAKKKIKEWVDAYNEYQKLCKDLTKYTKTEKGEAADKSNGPLIGDSTVRGIQNTIRGQIRTPNGDGTLNTMSKLGIKQKLDGTLEIDDKVLDKALKENGSSVKEFFAGDGKETGFATENFNYLKKILDSREGTIHNATDGLEKKKKGIDKRIEQTNKQIENTMDLYRRQFQNLDKMMNSLSGTTQALGRMLG